MKDLREKEAYHDRIWSEKIKDKESSDDKLNEANVTIIKILPECKSVLEVGCGTGILAKELKRMNKDVTGLDVSKLALRNAEKKGIKTIHHDLDQPLPFPDNSFDCVICCQVLQHIHRPSKLIKEMQRVTKKYVIINVPNIAYWKYRKMLLTGKIPFIGDPDYLPIRFFTLKTIKKQLNKSGLEIKNISYTGGLPLRRFIPKAFRKNISLLKHTPGMFATGFTILCTKH